MPPRRTPRQRDLIPDERTAWHGSSTCVGCSRWPVYYAPVFGGFLCLPCWKARTGRKEN